MSPQMKSLQDVRQLAGGELSLKARLGYVALLLVAMAMTTVVVSLWLTEARLPLRTQMAFGVMSIIGASWVVFSAWALRTRRPLFARDRVIAGRMAVAFTSLFFAGSIAAVVLANNAAAYLVLFTSVAMLAAAVRVLAGARRRFADLLVRRRALEG
jgi:hypothetical protein